MTTSAPEPDLDLFISHASADNDAVSQIDAALNAAGITTWVDHEHGITYGDRWMDAIHAATLRCNNCLYILTPAAARSEWCKRELLRMEQLKRKVFVALLQPMEAWQIPMIINDVQYADLTRARLGDVGDATLRGLADAILGKRRWEKTLESTARKQRVTGAYPFNDLIYTLYGRNGDVEAVQAALATAGRELPIVMLLGIGGVGKTRLAVEIVDQLDLRDGVIWHSFNSNLSVRDNTPARTAELIRDHLGLPATTPDEASWAALSGRETLLVLDNAEDCLPSARADYARLLRGLREGPRVLITSRHAWTELERSREHDLHAPSPEDGELILARMAEVKGYGARLDGQTAALAKVARYHPRLMLYAVGWLKAHEPQVIIKALGDLKGKEVDKALAEMVGETLEQMTAQEGGDALLALRRLCVTRGGFDRAAAEALLAAQLEDDPMLSSITTLVAWNLLEFDGARYSIDPLVARAAGEDADACAAHCDHYIACAKAQHKVQDYAALDPDAANLDSAVAWARVQKDAARAVELARFGGYFLLNRGLIRQEFAWARDAAELTNRATDAALWALAQNNLGNAYNNLASAEDRADNLRRAIATYEHALEYRTPHSAPLDYAATQNNLGLAYWELSTVEDPTNNLHRAIEAYRRALEHRTAQEDPRGYAMTQNNVGLAYWYLANEHDRVQNLRHAIKAYECALKYRTPHSAPLEYAMTQNNLGIVYSELALEEERSFNLHRAIDAYERALVHRTPRADPRGYAMTQNNLGSAHYNLARDENKSHNLYCAIAAFERALGVYTPLDAPLDYAMTQNNLGLVLWEMGDAQAACRAWSECETYYRRMGNVAQADAILSYMRANSCAGV